MSLCWNAKTTESFWRQREIVFNKKRIDERHLLIVNKNLFPELFLEIFLDYKNYLVLEVQHNNFKYNKLETQQLLEKYILLV